MKPLSPLAGGQASLSRSAQSSPAAHAVLDDVPVPGAASPQGPDQSRAVSAPEGGLRGRRLDDAGVFQGVLEARCMGPRDANWR